MQEQDEQRTEPCRNRLVSVLCCGVVFGLGLLSRSSLVPLPAFMAKYAGDALWALLIFLGFGFLFPSSSTTSVASFAVLFSVSIEFSQLYHAPWIDALRRTTPGMLVLGDTFAWADIAAYLVGIVGGVGCESLIAPGALARPRAPRLRVPHIPIPAGQSAPHSSESRPAHRTPDTESSDPPG